ncbi:hypothetical protein PV04_07708 [Phialophora macrospora]|uniref:Uncharacterized protein n=1 Tax=Phialophora macrospora TaxID=1851006 RepID=A0A0D2G007_9EURO|nr:hypothetical protein PV04_07708 [Phialophora macrospora]
MAPLSNSNANSANRNTQPPRTNNSTRDSSSTSLDSRKNPSIGSRDKKEYGNGVSRLAEGFECFRPFAEVDQAGRSQILDTRQVWGYTWGGTSSEDTNSHGNSNSNSNSRVGDNGQGDNRKSSDEEGNLDWVWRQADEAADGASWWERK